MQKSLERQRQAGHSLLNFKISYEVRMRLLANDLQAFDDLKFSAHYTVSKFEVATRMGQLQALVRISPVTTQVVGEIGRLTEWFVAILLQPQKETVN